MSDEPNAQRSGRLTLRGRSTDDDAWRRLQAHQEADGAWTIRVGDAPGVTLSMLDMVALAEAILERSR